MSARRIAPALLLAGAACSHAKPATFPAPSVRDVAFYPAASLASLGDSLAAQNVPARVLGDRGDYQYVVVRRDASGAPERHARWTDVIIVQAGTATVLIGGTLSGQHLESPGEERGGTIAGAEVRTIGAGDLLVIPAGLPHQVQVGSGGSVRYLVVKAPEPRR